MSTAENPHAGQGMVVLDIGGDIGALIVTAPTSMIGLEIEICPAGARDQVPDEGGTWWEGEWHSHQHAHSHGPAWPHVEVLERPHGDGRLAPVAVYPGLLAGRYELWRRPNEPTALTIDVTGAEITTATWPDPDRMREVDHA